MLITKGVTTGEVVTLKLASGEELIGKLTEDTDTHYVIERPLTLVMTPQGMGLQPWLLAVDPSKAIRFPKDRVVVCLETAKDMSNQYLQGTTGIALA